MDGRRRHMKTGTHALILLLSVILLAGTVSRFAAPPAAEAASPGFAGIATPSSDEAAIRRLVEQGAASHFPGGYRLSVDSLSLSNDWGAVSASLVEPKTGRRIGANGLLIIARHVGSEWIVAFPTDSQYYTWAQNAPTNVVGNESKAFLKQSSVSSRQPSQATASMPELLSIGIKLPWPAGLSRCISGYGYDQGDHTGTDLYALDFGLSYENVSAVAAGTVSQVATGQPNTYPNGPLSYGNYVLIDHGGILSLYAHLSAVNVVVGQAVNQGDVIGVSGNSGYSSGPHMHFRLRDGSWNPIMPEPMSGYTGFVGYSCSSGIYYVSDNGTVGAACPGPSLNNPADGFVFNSDSVSFSWSAPTGCTYGGYTFRIKDTSNMDSGGTTIVDTGDGDTNWSGSVAGFDNTDLYWGVRTANPFSPNWSVRRFRIQPIQTPPPPGLEGPSNGASFAEGQSITLSWSGAGDQFYAEIWGGPAGTTNTGWQSGTSNTIGSQWPGYTYSWHVKARNSGGEGPYSPTWTFVVKPAAPSNLS